MFPFKNQRWSNNSIQPYEAEEEEEDVADDDGVFPEEDEEDFVLDFVDDVIVVDVDVVVVVGLCLDFNRRFRKACATLARATSALTGSHCPDEAFFFKNWEE